ncbi:glutamate racemase [Pontixanthobacter aestiaquae]|uniref:Glutamate racemase n=1 Tax=Pontixanthobacter aestiaquae TaxID=1509367 RepID=A0A844Z7P5_9SPHN|nr:glutamate racemase [Pontixanthobacter aestiaquae]MDN3645651.1 glutamate racemase [Pontixanthobacter aestiaquae]MXO83352.1 glutamate racemase [Pontixanthobacter aestiaquae]
MRAEAPILIFDSGVGGLTVLAELRKILPTAPVVFAADQAGFPYGAKSEAEIAARVAGLLGRMSERYRPRLACIACNTASTIALEMVREVLEIPIVGTVPAIKPAAAITKTGTIGLLGTEATIRQGYVDRLETRFANGKTLLRFGAPGLVRAAEAKLRGQALDTDAIANAVSGLRDQPGGDQIDTVVLACTHFPLLVDELGAAFGSNVTFVDGAAGIARRIVSLCEGQSFASDIPSLAITTGSFDQFTPLARLFADHGIDQLDRF